MNGTGTETVRTDLRSRYEENGPVLSLTEVALLLWDDGLTDRVLPRNHIAMIEKRALAKLRRNSKVRDLARTVGIRIG